MNTQPLPEPSSLPPDGGRIPPVLRAEDVDASDFPLAMRGYERDAVERRLRRIAADYRAVIGQRDRLQALVTESNERAIDAEAEVQASARDLAAATKLSSGLEHDLDVARARIVELERVVVELEAGPSEDAEARVAGEQELLRSRARIAELESEAQRLRGEREQAVAMAESATAALATAEASAAEAIAAAEAAGERVADPEPDRQIDEFLRAAVRASETLRASARDEAHRTLKKARERSAELNRETARQARALEIAKDQVARLRASARTASAELERAREAQEEAERQAEHVKETMQAEVEQTVASLEAQRERVQTVLGNALSEALAALQSGGDASTSLFADLTARLTPTDEGHAETAPDTTDGSDRPDPEPAEQLDQA